MERSSTLCLAQMTQSDAAESRPDMPMFGCIRFAADVERYFTSETASVVRPGLALTKHRVVVTDLLPGHRQAEAIQQAEAVQICGRVNPNWPHDDGLRRHRTSPLVARRTGRRSPVPDYLEAAKSTV